MAKILSNELKAVVVLEDLTENPANILKDKCLTVQKFDYDCVRKRTQKGGVYGAINPVILSFTVRVNDQLQPCASSRQSSPTMSPASRSCSMPPTTLCSV